jgi:monofunctional biosynthetic peptidoglycan transglycosylase
MADGKTRNARRAALGLGAAGLVWLLAVWPPPVWWRDHAPRQTAMMRAADPSPSVQRRALTPLTAFSPALRRIVVLAEDARFAEHCGVDVVAIREALGIPLDAGLWRTVGAAWNARRHIRGASTITQQLAKNLYLSPSRNPVRKLRELFITRRLEASLSKRRILEIYLNVIEWGDGIFGCEAAARAYFGKSAAELSREEAALMAGAIVNPRELHVGRPNRRLLRRQQIVLRRMGN